jgi:hypothetical protein
MGKFLKTEYRPQAIFKTTSSYFSDDARIDGEYAIEKNDKTIEMIGPFDFCLPLECAEENLFPEICQKILTYFATHKIKWHDGRNGKPGNHLCDSMVCCVNFLFQFADKPNALAELLSPVFPSIKTMLPIENKQYVAFEWIGMKSYLGENWGKRGEYCTSADAIVMFKRTDGKRQIVLIEWKYAESYNGKSLKHPTRTKTYKPFFDAVDCPLNLNLLPSFDSLFFEPFYQFMRQQFLAHEMEKAHEMGADIVSVLHISPDCNTDFKLITSPTLKSSALGGSATEVWSKLVKDPDRFISRSTEGLFSDFDTNRYPDLKDWYKYVTSRYAWVKNHR